MTTCSFEIRVNKVICDPFCIMSRKSPKVELRYGPRKSE